MEQMAKSRDQFVRLTKPCDDALTYIQLAEELVSQGLMTYLPVMVEIPESRYKYSAEESAEFVRVSSREMAAWGVFSEDCMRQVEQVKNKGK